MTTQLHTLESNFNASIQRASSDDPPRVRLVLPPVLASGRLAPMIFRGSISSLQKIIPQFALHDDIADYAILESPTYTQYESVLQVTPDYYDKQHILQWIMGYTDPLLLNASAVYAGQTRKYEPIDRLIESIAKWKLIDGEYIVFGPFYNFSVLAELEIMFAERLVYTVGFDMVCNEDFGLQNGGKLRSSDLKYLRGVGIFVGFIYVLVGHRQLTE